ncbi:MAG: acyl-CoA thioesterase [Chloroflexota bacterium]
MTQMPAKRIAETRVQLAQLMQPTDANVVGNVHGGTLMKLADTAGAIVAVRHAGGRVATVVMDTMTFLEPVYVGDLLLLDAHMTWVGRSSMETEVVIDAEDLRTGQRRRVSTAFLVFVGIGEDGRPLEVPALDLELDAEKREFNEAADRRARRLADRGA